MPQASILILSDTHGWLDPRIAAEAAGADAVVHAGDIGASAVLDALKGPPVLAVVGNNDVAAKWVGPARIRARLPASARLLLPGGALSVEHGHQAGAAKGRHARLRARHPDSRAVVYGHSHRAVVDDEHAPWVLNPGAAGHTRTFGGPSFLWLTAGADRWEVERVVLPR